MSRQIKKNTTVSPSIAKPSRTGDELSTRATAYPADPADVNANYTIRESIL